MRTEKHYAGFGMHIVTNGFWGLVLPYLPAAEVETIPSKMRDAVESWRAAPRANFTNVPDELWKVAAFWDTHRCGEKRDKCGRCHGRGISECICRECDYAHETDCPECGGLGYLSCDPEWHFNNATFGIVISDRYHYNGELVGYAIHRLRQSMPEGVVSGRLFSRVDGILVFAAEGLEQFAVVMERRGPICGLPLVELPDPLAVVEEPAS